MISLMRAKNREGGLFLDWGVTYVIVFVLLLNNLT